MMMGTMMGVMIIHKVVGEEAAEEPPVRNISEVADSVEEPKAAEMPEAQERGPELASGSGSGQAPGGPAGWLNSILKQIFALLGCAGDSLQCFAGC